MVCVLLFALLSAGWEQLKSPGSTDLSGWLCQTCFYGGGVRDAAETASFMDKPPLPLYVSQNAQNAFNG